jgi:hypothetical protein
MQLVQQLGKGAFTYQPDDPAYTQHWNAAPLQPGST